MVMNGGIHALFLLFLLTIASQGSWCEADSSNSISADQHLQVKEFHGKKNLEIQSPKKHEVSTVEIKHPSHRRMAIAHKGGSIGGGTAGGGAGGAVARPHNKKNGAAALSVPVASVLALSWACGLALSVLTI